MSGAYNDVAFIHIRTDIRQGIPFAGDLKSFCFLNGWAVARLSIGWSGDIQEKT